MSARSRAALGAALAAALVTAIPASAIPKRLDRWIRVESPNFELFSDAREGTVRDLVESLEALHGVTSRSLDEGGADAPLPTKVFVFRNDASFDHYKLHFDGRPTDIGGYFSSDEIANYVAINGAPSVDPAEIIYHEYLHYVIRHALPPSVPLWLHEGLAEFYTTFEIRDGKALIGLPVVRHLEWLQRNELIPLDTFFAIDTGSPLYHEGDRRGVFYAQSWALTHFFLSGDADQRAAFRDFLRRLEAQPPAAALHDSFGLDFAALEQLLRIYVNRRQFGFATVELPSLEPLEVTVDGLAPANAIAELGLLLAHQGASRHADALEHFRHALKLDPEHTGAIGGIGYVWEQQGRVEEAIAQYRRAASLAPHDYLPPFLLGAALLRRRQDDGVLLGTATAADPQIGEARDLLQRSLELRPDFAPAYLYLGYSYALGEPPDARGLEALATARRLLPGRPEIYYNEVLLAARLGRDEEAMRALTAMEQLGADPALLREARLLLLRMELLRVHGAIEADRLDAADAALQELTRKVPWIADDPEVRGLVGEVAREITSARRVALYNRAVDLTNAQRAAEALDLVRRLLSHADLDPQLRRAAADLEQTLESFLQRGRPRRRDP